MNIKRYTAKDMRHALALVREEMGPDAVILSNRRLSNGQHSNVEILAASEYDESLLTHMSSKQVSTRSSRLVRTNSSETASDARLQKKGKVDVNTIGRKLKSRQFYRSSDTDSNEDPAGGTSKPSVIEQNREHDDSNGSFSESIDESVSVPGATSRGISPGQIEQLYSGMYKQNSLSTELLSGDSDALGGMYSELKSLRAMLMSRFTVDDWERQSSMNPLRVSLFRKLTDMGLSQDVCKFLVKGIDEKQNFVSAYKIALKRLIRHIPVDEHNVLKHGGIVALVGPTGVGKTATVVKIATRFVMQHDKEQLALISTDNYRIGAREQLLHYGRILGVPVQVANSVDRLAVILQKVANKKLVLIDTAGMSQQDIRLSQQCAALNNCAARIRTYLVMSANAQLPANDEVVRSFRETKLSGCMFTKIDESASLGGALSIIMRHNLAVACLCNGQRVPEDFAMANATSMVKQALKLMKSHKHVHDDEFLAATFSGGVSHAYL